MMREDKGNNGATGEMTGSDTNFIVVRGAYKRYGLRSTVLRGLNMTVARGTIYAFLGPSGCGKTTLLGCIVGRKRLDAGEIQTGVKYRSQVGYMPQELALLKEFSISETLSYYACLYGMNRTELKKRKDELFNFLELPPEQNRIDEISGGQQRRVSLCVALLHNPELLILDEPTVGVDPVLSHSIWQHLLQMSTFDHKTIVVTTHYIEEAKQAHRVGMMRGGVLLTEGEPKTLMNNYGCDTLESLFLQLSQKQASNNIDVDNDQVYEDYPKPAKKPKPPIGGKHQFVLHHFYAHILKNFYYMRRNKPILGFLLLLPVVQCMLFDMTVGRDPHGLKVGIVNDELVNGRADCYTTANMSCPISYPASCRFMDALESKQMRLIVYDDVESAKLAGKRNDVWGYMHIAKNYTDCLHERISMNTHTSDEALTTSEVDVWMDMSNQYIGNLLRRDMYYAYMEYLEQLYIDCEWPVQAARIPIFFHKAVYGSIYPRFADFAVPAVLQLFEFYLPMMFTVGAILMEKREGIMERGLISGMTLLEQMLGHATVALGILIVQTFFMMIVLFVIFDNVIEGSLFLALTLLFLVGISGMCYGYLVSVLCDTDQAATYMGLGSFFPLSMLSGMVWPYQGMHWLLRTFGWFLPLTLSTEAFRSISTRAWGLSHPVVYSGFLSAIGWIFFFSISTIVVIKIKKGLRSIL